jgi:hypothetical protein
MEHGDLVAKHRISAFFDMELRASSPSQAMSCRKIRQSSCTITASDHAHHHRLVMPPVTAVDDLFGTHRADKHEACSPPTQGLLGRHFVDGKAPTIQQQCDNLAYPCPPEGGV